MPIYQTTSYVFEDTAHAAALFNLQRFGNIYTRIMNPTTAVVRGAHGGARTRRGRAGGGQRAGGAVHRHWSSLLDAGDEIVAAKTLYGGTYTQFDVSFRRLGHRHHVRRSGRSGEFPPRHHAAHPRALCGDHRQPAHERARHRRRGDDRAREQPSAHRSTTLSRRPTCAVPSSMAPTSWSIPPPSSLAGTARRSAA